MSEIVFMNMLKIGESKYCHISTCHDMPVLKVELVVGSEHVAGDHRGEEPSVLLAVAAVHHVQHPLGIGVAKVGRVRGAVVNLDRDKNIAANIKNQDI